MKHCVNGLVLREVKTGEADRILSILTPRQGIISAAAKGSMRPKSKLFSGTSLFCYSEFSLYEGKTMYRVDEASPIEVFFGLRDSIEGISLAAYFAEMLQILSPTQEDADTLLRLTLNSLYILAQNRRKPEMVKAVYELRALSESGFMPDLLACYNCGKYEDNSFYFTPRGGRLLCATCAEKRGRVPNLDAASLAALRHIILTDDEKLFSFTLTGNSMMLLSQVAEEYVLHNLDYPPKTMSFLKTIL